MRPYPSSVSWRHAHWTPKCAGTLFLYLLQVVMTCQERRRQADQSQLRKITPLFEYDWPCLILGSGKFITDCPLRVVDQ